MSELLTPSAVLRAARELISTPERWTRGAFARDGFGNQVRIADPSGCSFCVRGAIGRTRDMGATVRAKQEAELLLGGQLPGRFQYSLARWNDHFETTHASVMEALDAAILAAETEGRDA